ncbi:filamin-A-interacting protein 1 isoform X2 [Drosophila rhopaloa]|uniref:Filamin-A-interacting protein 1 isoform X2 n=1 Tax=Drosophila rhopaloa TaxID=1041015 RepID=A0A6P4F1Q4_DRORH|nr:filamin-A-interacting protein 1 isoform X2 [Drosophila rhopaloa]
MSSKVRGNKASMLRAKGNVEKPTPTTLSWAPASTRCAEFAPAPSINPGSRSTSRSRSQVPTIRVPTSRIPIRRGLGTSSRNTSPVRASPLKGPSSVSACSLPNRLPFESKLGDHDRETDVDKETCKRDSPSRRTKVLVHERKENLDDTGKSHRRVIELNKVRALESEKKKLEYMQSEFMHKLRSLGSQKLEGVYKFVAFVFNEECKIVVHEEDLLRLPKNLPAESVRDLKDRCRSVVDMGFMVLYDHLQFIHRAKDEFEARAKREDIRNKLKNLVNRKMKSITEEIEQLCNPNPKTECANPSLYREMADLRLEKKHMEGRYFDIRKEHCDQMNQLKAEHEAKLASELANRDQVISELKKSLRRTEEVVSEQSIRLAEKKASLIDEDGTIEELRSELAKLKSVNQRMFQRLEEADVGLERARQSIDKHLGRITYLEGELKEARELIVNLQKRPDVMDSGVMEKDLIIADLKLQLHNLEQHKNVLNNQVSNALKQHADYDDLSGKYRKAVMQISELKEALKVKSDESESHVQAEEQLNKEMVKMREKINLDQQMLNARSDLINSLQKNEQENRTKMDKMYYQVNIELASKEEESRNLFGTLTFKQKEVRRQEHVIQLLKEQKARGSMARVEQEERNVIMQEEIKRLKQTLQGYARIIIGNSGQHFFEVVPADEVPRNRSSGNRDRGETPISNGMNCDWTNPQEQEVSPPHGRFFEPLQHQLLQHQRSVSPRHSHVDLQHSTRHSLRSRLHHPRNHHQNSQHTMHHLPSLQLRRHQQSRDRR